MSGQQPPHGPPQYGQQPPGQPPPYGQQPPGQPPQYGRPPGGAPPPGSGPPPAGWQPQPGSPESPKATRRGATTALVVGLSVLVVLLAALSAYLWFGDSDGSAGSGSNASTEKVELPEELGDFTATDDEEIDWDQTNKDYEEALGASVTAKTYEPAGDSGDSDSGDSDSDSSSTVSVNVQAVRADLGAIPSYTTDTSSNEIVRDDMVCRLADYSSEDEEGEQLPQACTRSDDGLTIFVTTYTTTEDKDAPNLDAMVDLTDAAYDAAK